MSSFFSRDLIWLDVDNNNQQDFFKTLANKLLRLGYIKASYLTNIISREKNYPTGLVMPMMNIAIPHTDPKHIINPFIAVTKLQAPITFIEMGSDTDYINVQWVFALGITDGKNQVSLLQNLIQLFNNSGYVNKIKNATSSDELYDFLVEVY